MEYNGLTKLKKGNEYMISLILALAVLLIGFVVYGGIFGNEVVDFEIPEKSEDEKCSCTGQRL